MKICKVCVIRFQVFVIGIFLSTLSHAGWFGPSSFDECMVDNLGKNPNKYLYGSVRSMCMKKFPIKEDITFIQNGNLFKTLNWVMRPVKNDSVDILLQVDNFTNYKINYLLVEINSCDGSGLNVGVYKLLPLKESVSNKIANVELFKSLPQNISKDFINSVEDKCLNIKKIVGERFDLK